MLEDESTHDYAVLGTTRGHETWVSTHDYAVLGTTRGHETWVQAARAALKLADRRGCLVTNRELIERRIASGAT
jgi:hypothetical protein